MSFLILKVLIFSLIGGFIGRLIITDKSESSFEVFREIFEFSFLIIGVLIIVFCAIYFFNI